MAKDMKFAVLLDFYSDILTDKQREITDLYYNEDMSLGEIAENLGITRQGVRDAVKRSEQMMLDAEQRIGACGRFLEYQGALKEIQRIAKAMSSQNRGYSYSKFTDDGTREIISIAAKLID